MTAPNRQESGKRRALGLRCPVCGGDKAFESFFKMRNRCRSCGFVYEREPGYFLGSTYLNYGVTVVLVGITTIVMTFGFDVPVEKCWPAWLVVGTGFPLFFFRYARLWWTALDIRLDPPTEKDFSDRDRNIRPLE
jgi:uncharacterized protein (DUF983 family)